MAVYLPTRKGLVWHRWINYTLKHIMIKTTTDYTKLPDGTILIDRSGARNVKGPHPLAGHVKAFREDEPLFFWREGQERRTMPSWNANGANGKCQEGHQDLDIIGYEVQEVGTYPAVVVDAERVTVALRVPKWNAKTKPASRGNGLSTVACSTHLFGCWRHHVE